MAIVDWIDTVCDLFGTISDGYGGTVKSYRVYNPLRKIDEFPESLSVFPCALTYVPAINKIMYSKGGPCIIWWRGVTEVHIVGNVQKSNYPYVHDFYARIMAAVASSMQLGGLVASFLLAESEPMVSGELTYGGTEGHLGIVVNWQVKEDVTGEFTLSS